MTRLKNWPSRFAALVGSVRAKPFAWGVHDCCLWSADAVQALTGVDPAEKWRGTYGTERGALALLSGLGGLVSIGALAGPKVPCAMATIGDIGMVTWPDGAVSLAVCSGSAWLCAGEAGQVVLPLSAATRAWGVGRE